MILFKASNVFAELDVITGSERTVHRREVTHTTTGLTNGQVHAATGFATRDEATTQRDDLEIAEVV